jgi:STE24 endopeptidase
MFAAFGFFSQYEPMYRAFGFEDEKPVLVGMVIVMQYIFSPYNAVNNYYLVYIGSEINLKYLFRFLAAC